MTGNYPQVCTGFKSNTGRIKENQPILTETLKNAGYKTYAFGKLHFVPYSPPDKPRLLHGFEHVDLHESGRILDHYAPRKKASGIEDYFDYLEKAGWGGYGRAHGIGNNDVRPCASPLPKEHYVDHWIADCTINKIDTHIKTSTDKPFFMWMSSPKPHSPYDPPRPFDQMYDPREMPAPLGSSENLKERFAYMEAIRHKCAVDSLSPEAWKLIRSYYYGSISFLDSMIGRVLEHLDKNKILDETLVLFTADHGDLIGDFGSCFKVNLLNGSVRTPFIVAGPGISKNRKSEALVGLQDILPTFAAFAGTKLNAEVQGGNLMPLLTGSEQKVRDHYYSTTDECWGQSAMITDGKFKYIYSEGNGTEELYDQINDISELKNLASDPLFSGKRDEMRKLLVESARNLKDDDILCENGLKTSHIDRSNFEDLPSNGMGWRWY
jgi:arylsulfatase A-like enzyme